MATNEKAAAPEAMKVAAEPAQPLLTKSFDLFRADITLRLLLFTTTLVALVVTVTSKQSVPLDLPFSPLPLVVDAKFTYSPALIYFVVVMAVACLYSLVTVTGSVLAIYKPLHTAKLLLFLGLLDALMAGIVASATGAVASLAYIGLKGNSHIGWNKVCNIFDKFCRYVGSSIIISLIASIILVFLVGISTYSLYHRVRNTC